MNYRTVLRKRIDERGISYAELERRTGVSQVLLGRVCREVSDLKATDFVKICCELDLDWEDFIDCLNN